MNWPAVDAARLRSTLRVPYFIGAQRVGSVAAAHLDALRVHAPALQLRDHAVTLPAADNDATAVLAPVDEALALAASDEMTVDASLVTLDFALRHALLPRSDAEALTALTRSLWLAAP